MNCNTGVNCLNKHQIKGCFNLALNIPNVLLDLYENCDKLCKYCQIQLHKTKACVIFAFFFVFLCAVYMLHFSVSESISGLRVLLSLIFK